MAVARVPTRERGSLRAEEFAEHRVHLHRLFLLDLLVRPEDDTYG